MRDNKSFIYSLKEFDIVLAKEQEEKFEQYFDLLVEWNKIMNLTSITEYQEVITKHFIDSLSIVKVLLHDQLEEASLIDVGTGAGFPGIPLKIVFPKMRVVLLDSLNKRVTFLDHVIKKLELKDIKAIHGRAEELARKNEYREQYDICVSRAVAKLVTLSEYCIPFVKLGGYFVSYKSTNFEEEKIGSEPAILKLGGKIIEVKKFILPGSDISRVNVLIEKNKQTDKKYPRIGGKPIRQPLQ